MKLSDKDRLIITGLTVAGFCFLFADDEAKADFCWKTAVRLLPLGMFINAKLAKAAAS